MGMNTGDWKLEAQGLEDKRAKSNFLFSNNQSPKYGILYVACAI